MIGLPATGTSTMRGGTNKFYPWFGAQIVVYTDGTMQIEVEPAGLRV